MDKTKIDLSSALRNNGTLKLMQQMRRNSNKSTTVDTKDSNSTSVNNNGIKEALNALNDNIDRLKNENVIFRKSLQTNADELKESSVIIRENKENIIKAQTVIESLNLEKQKLEAELAQFKQGITENINNTKNEIANDLQTQITNLEGKINTENNVLKVQIDNNLASIKASSEVIAENRTEMARVITEIASLDEKEKNLESELSEFKGGLTRDINTVKTESESLKAVVENNSTLINANSEVIAENKIRSEKALKKINTVKNENENLKAVVENNSTLINANSDQINQIQTQLTTIVDADTNTKNLLNQFQERIQSLEKFDESFKEEFKNYIELNKEEFENYTEQNKEKFDFLFQQSLNNFLTQLTTQGKVSEIVDALEQFKDEENQEENQFVEDLDDPISLVVSYGYLEQALKDIDQYGFDSCKERVLMEMKETKSKVDTETFNDLLSQMYNNPQETATSGDDSTLLSEDY